mmetsp:Transcript_19580/g.51911  ORF Transcript_19580/g.51911 Transcript_19580/m.51911 type:complete len:273 (+) Transcript_19580:90-908(+)
MAGQQRAGAPRVSWPLVLAALLCCAGPTTAEDPPAPEAPAAAEDPQTDETKALLNQLTISMIAEVVDERTLSIRDTAAKGRKLLRLGNSAGPAKGSLSDEDHKEKLEGSKAALTKLVGKQMIWWKAAAAEHQPPADSDTVVGDVWLIDGRHVNSMLKKEGHLLHVEEYQEELAKNILTAAADEAKRESYKELEEALKESEKAKQKAEKEARKVEEASKPGEPLGVGGYVGIAIVAVLALGVLTNFGQPTKKKTNLNRQKGPLERLWFKLKGA